MKIVFYGRLDVRCMHENVQTVLFLHNIIQEQSKCIKKYTITEKHGFWLTLSRRGRGGSF